MTKHIITTIVTLLCVFCCFGQTPDDSVKRKIITGYSGGMMIHVGWAEGNLGSMDYNARGVVSGIGGAARLNLGRLFRVGTEGYVSTMKQKKRPDVSKGSYLKHSWGGLLADICVPLGRVSPYAGVTLLGGGHSALLFNGACDGTPSAARLVKGAFLGVDPFVGCNVNLSETLALTFKVDCLQGWGVGKTAGTRLPIGPRLFVGVMFNH